MINFLFFSRTGRAGNKGFAFTFITPEQERYSGDIIKALELSGADVPMELKTMWDVYKARARLVCCCILFFVIYGLFVLTVFTKVALPIDQSSSQTDSDPEMTEIFCHFCLDCIFSV